MSIEAGQLHRSGIPQRLVEAALGRLATCTSDTDSDVRGRLKRHLVRSRSTRVRFHSCRKHQRKASGQRGRSAAKRPQNRRAAERPGTGERETVAKLGVDATGNGRSARRRGEGAWRFRLGTRRRICPSVRVRHQVVPQRSTQLHRRAHVEHPGGGAARTETLVSCNSLIPLRSRRPRPTP